MNTPILFYKSPTASNSVFGSEQMILLEDTGTRLVVLHRDFGDNDIYRPWINVGYSEYRSKGDIEAFHEEISNGNYLCAGVYDIATDEAAGHKLRSETL